MYILNKEKNAIEPLKKTKFADQKLYERQHLQEWLAKHPDALSNGGDDRVLIIQKEFNSFNDTDERLDLLALDTNGNLVIIENKLDDSGRDVVWQALKYTGYCANLLKEGIVEIFQKYLDKNNVGENLIAEKRIADFLGKDSLEEEVLNQPNTQRIILVAANFRKEVTNTVLWLMQFGVNIQCFRVTPYILDDKIFLDIQKIIPIPGAEEYMIGFANKERERSNHLSKNQDIHKRRKCFWKQLLEKIKNSECSLYNFISPSTEANLHAGSGIGGFSYALTFGGNDIKVKFYLNKSDVKINEFAFNWFSEKRENIERVFGNKLEWNKTEGIKVKSIEFTEDITEGHSEENWDEMQDWLISNITSLEHAISPYLNELKQAISEETKTFTS